MQNGTQALLVTGASGMLGFTLCRQAYLSGSWRVVGVVHSHPAAMRGVEIVHTDLTDRRALNDLFERKAPDAVIHTAAASKPNWCELHPDQSRRLNVDASEAIAGLCDEFGAACVFTSTDLVFDGTRGMYREDEFPNPVSRYGAQKVEAEQAMRERLSGVTICRLPLMYGPASPSSMSFLQPLLKSLHDGIALDLFDDEYRSPARAQCVSKGLLMAVEHRGETFHLGGPRRLSRYDFGLVLCDTFGFDRRLVHRRSQKDISMAAPRPADVSLDSSRAFAVGYAPLDPEKGLRTFIGQV